MLLVVVALAAFIGCSVIPYIFFRKKRNQKTIDSLDSLYSNIKRDIKHSIAPSFITFTPEINDLIELAIEVWRIEHRINRALTILEEDKQCGLKNSIKRLKKYLEKCDVETRDYTNQKFNDGLNLNILSIVKDSAQNHPIVKETIEPTIMFKGQVVHKAKIILLSN